MSYTIEQALEKLNANGFLALIVNSAAEARDYLLKDIACTEQVGIGGSKTIQSLGVAELLRARGNDVVWHWPGFERDLREQLSVDAYLLSANAVTNHGILVNIDGVGNRVASSIFPKGRVYYVIGRQKLVDGGYEQAVARIKRDVCPQNAKRRNAQTPCGLTGKCDAANCHVPECMCNIYVAIHHPPRGKRVTILLVNEDLGL